MSELSRIDINNVNYGLKDEVARSVYQTLNGVIGQEQATRIATCVVSGNYNSQDKTIELLNANNEVVDTIDATLFVKDGMVSDVSIVNENLVITFNTDSGKSPISIPLTSIFNPSNYYQKSEIDSKLADHIVLFSELDNFKDSNLRDNSTPSRYVVVDSVANKRKVGTLDIISDSMNHVVTQVLITHQNYDDSTGTISSVAHDDKTVVCVYRSIKISGGTLPDTNWTRWNYINDEVLKSIEGGLRYMSFKDGVFNVSLYNAVGSTLTRYETLALALAAVPEEYQNGGMSIKYVNTTGEYEQYRLMSSAWSNVVTNWQGVDDVPTAGSENLVQSGGVYSNTPTVTNSTAGTDLDISDEQGNVLVRFAGGHLQVKNFSSADALESIQAILSNIGFDNVPEFDEEDDYAVGDIVRYGKYVYVFTSAHTVGAWDDTEVEKTVLTSESQVKVTDSQSEADLDISDERGNVLARFSGGHIKTKNFDSSKPQSVLYDNVVAKDGSGQYSSITSAIENTHDGDIIYIKSGTYEESIHMWGKNRHIIGECRETTIIKNGTGNYSTPPLEANLGSIRNLTIIADNYSPTIHDPYTTHDKASYGIHIEYANDTDYSLIIDNCTIISKWNAAIGLGCRYNQKVIIRNCELITYMVQGWSDTSGNYIRQGALFFHNDATISNRPGGILQISETILRGNYSALSVYSLNNGSSMTAEFISCTLVCDQYGLEGDVIYKREQSVAEGRFAGQDIYLGIASNGNNINELNNN